MTLRFTTAAALSLAISFVWCSFSHSGIVLSFVPATTNVNFTVNSTEQFVIGVQIAADSGTQNIQGYSIPVDFRNPIGTDAPPGWTVTAVNYVTNFSSGVLFTGDINPGFGDAYGSDVRTAGPIQFTTSPVTLFEITVQVARGTAVNGDYLASFVSSGPLFSLDVAENTPLPLSQINATATAPIRITGVPEPSSLVFLAVACAGGVIVGSRRFARRILA
jgi:hypothetical protein